jgi:DNA-binding NtrC family response regulator
MNLSDFTSIVLIATEDTVKGKRLAETVEGFGFVFIPGMSLSEVKQLSGRFAAFYGVPRAGEQDSARSAPNRLALGDMERSHIRTVLDICGWKYKTAAKALGIDRTTLYRKMKKYGMRKEE